MFCLDSLVIRSIILPRLAASTFVLHYPCCRFAKNRWMMSSLAFELFTARIFRGLLPIIKSAASPIKGLSFAFHCYSIPDTSFRCLLVCKNRKVCLPTMVTIRGGEALPVECCERELDGDALVHTTPAGLIHYATHKRNGPANFVEGMRLLENTKTSLRRV